MPEARFILATTVVLAALAPLDVANAQSAGRTPSAQPAPAEGAFRHHGPSRIIHTPAPPRIISVTAPPPAPRTSAQAAPIQAAPVAPSSSQPSPARTPGLQMFAPGAVTAPAPAPAPAEPQASASAPLPAPAATEPVSAPPRVVEAPPQAPRPDAAADADVTAKLRELLANSRNAERFVPRKNERDAIAAFYQTRSFALLWIERGGLTARGQKAAAYLRGVAAEGLDPADYPAPDFRTVSAEGLAEAELRYTATLLTFARHALNGRVHWSRVSPNIDYKERFEPADALNKIATSGDMARTLDQFLPQHAGYKALKTKLADLRAAGPHAGVTPIADGPVLRYGRDRNGREVLMSDPRVPALRERLGLPAEPTTAYNKALAAAVAKFQKDHGLQATGQLNSATIAALNPMSRDKQIEIVSANLERWRWMPRDFGRVHVALNIPDYHLRVMNQGEQVWMTRVVVGKPSQATPLITETMKFITVNPTWNVPQSIIYNELLPIYETSDRAVFDKMGLRVERRSNGEIRVFQPSGERNALGRIRFNFPNKFLVYQHDTPEKYYFSHSRRAYSHGCMRVQDPLKYAEVLLSFAAPRANHTQESLRRMFGDEERQIDFQHQIPVHISYQTAFVDEAGKLQFREDIYGIDARQIAMLQGEERRMADVVMDRPADPNFQATPEHLRRLQNVARGGNPFALFEQLFR